MMDQLSFRTVRTILLEMEDGESFDVRSLIDQLEEDQPVIFEFLFYLDELPFNLTRAIGQVDFNEEELANINYNGLVIWRLLRLNPYSMREVTWEDLDDVVEELADSGIQPEADLKHLPGVYRRPVEPHPEPELLRMLGEIVRLEGVEPDHHPLRPAYRVPAYIVLYILMTALINSRED